MEGIEDLELEGREEVDVEFVLYHCHATIFVPDKHGHEPLKARANARIIARVSCIL